MRGRHRGGTEIIPRQGRGGGYHRLVNRLAVLLALAHVFGPSTAAGATRAAATPPVPAPGLAFAVTLEGSGELLASGPFLLRVPGAKGTLRLELSRLAVEGARLRGEARLRNDTGVLLAGLALDFESALTTPAGATEPHTATPVAVSLEEPLLFGELLAGETTPRLSFEVAPVPLGHEVALATLLGAVRGLAVEPSFAVAGAVQPVALDTDRYGRLYVATGGVGRVLRLSAANASAAASPAEAARPSPPPTGIALRRRNGDLFVSTGDRIIQVHRPGRPRPATLDAGRPVKTLRIDGKHVLRAASGNAVLAFDEAKAGPARALGPEGAEVVSFDADARGVVHAVVADGVGRRVAVSGASGPAPFSARKGPGSDALDAPSACRFDGEGTLWVSAVSGAPEGTVLARFLADGTPLVALSRLALGLLLGKEEGAAVPAIVDLAPGADRGLTVLLEDGSVFAVRPF